jgi:arylsulfatase A-like enzyme
MDGINQGPLLTQNKNINRNKPLYWHFPNYTGTGHPNASGPCSVIRDGEWKLIEYFEDGSLELYDLSKDLKEKNNLAKQYPQITADLHKKLIEWRKQAIVQMPRVNPDYKKRELPLQ